MQVVKLELEKAMLSCKSLTDQVHHSDKQSSDACLQVQATNAELYRIRTLGEIAVQKQSTSQAETEQLRAQVSQRDIGSH